MFDIFFWVVVSAACYFAYKPDSSLNASSCPSTRVFSRWDLPI